MYKFPLDMGYVRLLLRHWKKWIDKYICQNYCNKPSRFL